MKATELMVGDWVSLFQGNPDGSSCNVQVSYIGVYGEVGIEGCEEYTSANCNLLFPIPLTPEILEKNFSSTTDWYFIGTDKFCFRIDKYKYKWDLYFGRDGKGTNLRIKINYVHELQHALRLCRIDKEIEI